MTAKNGGADEAGFGSIIEDSAIGIYLIAVDSLTITQSTRGARRELDYTGAEMANKPLPDVFPEFTDERFRQLTASLLSQHDDRLRLETVHLRKDGTVYPVEVTLQLSRQCDPPVFVAWLNDISERREAEAEQAQTLRRAEAAEARFRELLESAPDAMVITERNGAIVMVNRMTEQLFGYRRDELIGKGVEILIPGRFHESHAGYVRQYANDPTPRPMGSRGVDLRARRKDGSEFFVEISLSPMQSHGKLLLNSAVRDITERKQFEQALEEQAKVLERSNAELEQFAYVASHDLQEPLRMVASYVQLLARRYKDRLDQDADEFIGFAVDGASRMQDLINDLLAYSRVTRITKPFESTDCEAVLHAVLVNLQWTAEENHARITHDPLPTLMADESQLVQLFQNCISNAIKFHHPGIQPHVHVGAQRQGDEWILSFCDNGIGIEPQYFERIFSVFQRLHGHGSYPGTGIGLAICKKIVEHHNGRVWVESEPGNGTTFYFAFPSRESSSST